jgi:hypothetical protein
MQSGVDAAGAAPVATVALFVVAVVLLAALADSCTPLPALIVAPVDGGDNNAPGGVAIVKVSTLRGSQPLETEQVDARKLGTPPIACVDEGEVTTGEEGSVGKAKGPVPAFGLLVWACAPSIATASQIMIVGIRVHAIALS